MIEKDFEKRLLYNLKRRGFFAKHTEILHMPGWPDLMLVKNNKAMFIELKMCGLNTKIKFRDIQIPFILDLLNYTKKVLLAVKEKGLQKYHYGYITREMLESIMCGVKLKDLELQSGVEIRALVDYVNKEIEK